MTRYALYLVHPAGLGVSADTGSAIGAVLVGPASERIKPHELAIQRNVKEGVIHVSVRQGEAISGGVMQRLLGASL